MVRGELVDDGERRGVVQRMALGAVRARALDHQAPAAVHEREVRDLAAARDPRRVTATVYAQVSRARLAATCNGEPGDRVTVGRHDQIDTAPSRYDNVAAVRYPPILAETSLNDTRVLYVEPAKWVARLRATALNGEDVLLRTEMSAGHGGVSGRYKSWHDRAFALAWILDRMGLAEAPAQPSGRQSGGPAAANP